LNFKSYVILTEDIKKRKAGIIMPIIKSYALPHPPLAIPDIGRGQEKGINTTLDAFYRVADEIASLKPDTIIYVTPHNILYSDYFHISPGQSARGDFTRFGVPGVKLEIEYDCELAGKISELAMKQCINAGTAGEKDAKLDHGVMVPMWFINSRYTGYKAIRISQSGMDPSIHYRMGAVIKDAVEALKRVAVFIASSDMSHKLKRDGPYGFSPEGPEFDEAVIKALASGDFLALMGLSDSIREKAAECGYNSLMMLAGTLDKQNAETEVLSYEGPFGVGYAVAAFTASGQNNNRDLLRQHNEKMLRITRREHESEDDYMALARKSLEHKVKTGKMLQLPGNLPEEMLVKRAGVFVSLHKEGRLRGCIGTIAPATGNIAHEIIQNAVSAGLKDPRFGQVTEQELPLLTYKVDVLATPEKIAGQNGLDVKRFGVIVSSGPKRGLLLPNLDGIDTVEEQIAIARKKGGISENEPISLERFEVVRHE